jgi:uncharacterized protein (TIGR03083 family)
MIDHLAVIERESARFAEATASLDSGGAVPSCPEWDVADLMWHLAEVQYFWGSIVEGLLTDPGGVEDLERPDDDDLADLVEAMSSRLVAAIGARNPDDACWSWHTGGETVGWVRRRQAHEALIHRVDADLAAGNATDVDEILATDGVDEMIRVMLDASDLPEWSEYHDAGTTAVIEVTGRGASWALELGRFTGESPNTGKVYDDPVVKLVSGVDTPSAVITGSGVDLDLWLWGRGPVDRLTVEGDRSVADHIREAAAAGSQ